MTEISTEENEQIVSNVYEEAMDAIHAGKPVTEGQRTIYDIEHLIQEVNSGASYEQYFRWSTIDEIKNICNQLNKLGLGQVAGITEKAITVAFPNGIPSSDEEKSEATDWTEEQEERLADLFNQVEEENGHVTNVLAEYAKRVGA